MTDINWVASYIRGELNQGTYRHVLSPVSGVEGRGWSLFAPTHLPTLPVSFLALLLFLSSLTVSHGQLGECVFHTAGWPHCLLPRHVSFLSCLLAGPPQGLLSTVVLWKVSASHSTLWPDIVIRNSYKKRQNTRRDGGGWGPQAAAQNMQSLIPRVTETNATLLPSHPI